MIDKLKKSTFTRSVAYPGLVVLFALSLLCAIPPAVFI